MRRGESGWDKWEEMVENGEVAKAVSASNELKLYRGLGGGIVKYIT